MNNDDILNDLDSLEGDDMEEIQEENDEDDFGESKHSDLLKNQKFIKHMECITALIDDKIQKGQLQTGANEFALINASNQYASAIDKEINSLFRYTKNIYNKKFPQLESIVTNPSHYCKAAKIIEQYEKGMAETQQIQGLKFPFLTSHQSISLKIALSSSHSKLSADQTHQLLEVTNIVSLLHEHHNALMMYLQSCMQIIAPNLCQLVGSSIASKLISAAGSIDKLSTIPACNIQVMGGQRSAQIGLTTERNHMGIFGQMDVVKDAPKRFQMQLVRMLAANTSKCARADFLKSKSSLGNKLRDEMYSRFQKIQEEGGLMRSQQPLPIPDDQPKKRRGGKRHRKNKQLYEMSELRQNQNRIKFGQAEQEIQDGVGLGMLKSGMGKLKVNIKKQKLNVSKKMANRMGKKTGIQSSLDLTASTGIQLINPSLLKVNQPTNGKQTYFSKEVGFKTVLNNKFSMN